MARMQTPQPGGGGLVSGWVDHVADLIKGPAGLMAGLMALLALAGTGITLTDPARARTYWLVLVPIYGLLCVLSAWRSTGQLTGSVTRQILHWLSVAAAIALDFAYLRHSGEPAGAATGLSSLLLLGLGSLLAGIHLNWLFALVGLLLLAIFAVVAMAQYAVTVAFLIAAAAALILAALWAVRR